MDFGVVGLDTLVCSNNGSLASENAAVGNSHKRQGSGFLNQERTVNEDELRGYTVAKTSSSGEAMLKKPLQRSKEAHQQMLSFSSPNSQALALPYYHQTSSQISRNAGYGSAGINAATVLLTGFRGPFTASQWMELEHQALIYKYIDANVPIPSYLLNPIRKALESAGFTGFSGLRPTALGWGGGFHLGFSNSDPEPGRCRRTDGKKWRCSRDAVADQKYCERHMNRGRHRSRKPVEGQSGNTNTNTNTNSLVKPAPLMASSKIASSNNTHLSGLPNINRNKETMEAEYQHTTVLSMNSPKISLNNNHHPHSISNGNAYEQESSSIRPTEFGLVCSDSLLNPLRQFMDEWPKSSQSENPVICWSDVARTHEFEATSPLRLSREFEATKVGLGVGPAFSDQRWEPSMGGPLGEVLHPVSSECMRTKSATLNFMENSWCNNNDNNSPRLRVPSPTGVLQRCVFGSASNSSAGSSPRAGSGNGIIGTGLMHPSLPAL